MICAAVTTCVPPCSLKRAPCTALKVPRRCARSARLSSCKGWLQRAPVVSTAPDGLAAAIVGHANLLLGDRVAPVLEALQAASPNRFRGIRHSVTWDPHPEVENTAAHRMRGQLGNEQFRAGARVLAGMGLSLEGWMYFPQLPELAAFAKAIPDLPIILNHIGGLVRTGPYANQGRRGAHHVAARDRGGGGVPECHHQSSEA